MIFSLLLALFLAVPFVELAVIIMVGSRIGVFETLGLLIVVSVVGAWLARREGLGVFRRIRQHLDAGRLPGRELIDGFLILFAGALLLTPGFVTDVVAISLLLPPVRVAVRGALRRTFERRIEVRAIGGRQGWRDNQWRDPGGRDGGVGEP